MEAISRICRPFKTRPVNEINLTKVVRNIKILFINVGQNSSFTIMINVTVKTGDNEYCIMYDGYICFQISVEHGSTLIEHPEGLGLYTRLSHHFELSLGLNSEWL
jgi:hypothetical protein